ncbi:metallophosphoesterase [Actinoplanes sichuanensis]|uniref:Uncharacterized protein n=1 Tax=Actinoplanes sichuanensis TaxID=512349 RepID=A0ABW4A166_9ACTN|nr:hypothetical protein [Actinoplanes sichuanensis]BEL04145.1 metallophosphoesterase [Actinoplanes sichuanensis]
MTEQPFRALAGVVVWLQRLPSRIPRHWSRRIGTAVAAVAVAWTGVTVGLLLFSNAETTVGPVQVQVSARLALSGETELRVPLFGSVRVDTHDAPVRLQATIINVDTEAAADLIADPAKLDQFTDDFLNDLAATIARLALRALGISILGGLVASALVFRNIRRIAAGGLLSLVSIGMVSALTAFTFRPGALASPQYSGLLENAPKVIGDARQVAAGYNDFGSGLVDLLFDANAAYKQLTVLPDLATAPGDTAVIHVSDLRSNPLAWSVVTQLAKRKNVAAVLDTGDATSLGNTLENRLLTTEVTRLGVPYLYVRGDQDSAATVAALTRTANAHVLDGDVVEVGPLRVAGISSTQRSVTTTVALSAADRAAVEAASRNLNGRIVDYNLTHAVPVNVVMMHEPEGAAEIGKSTPLVLTGFRSGRAVTALDDDTITMQQGRSGDGGVLHQNAPGQHFAMSVLYFTPQGRLRAYDDLVAYGPDLARIEVERHLTR